MNRLIVKLKMSKRGTILTLAAMLMLAAAGGAGGLLTRDVAAESVDITANIKPTLQVLLPADNILLNLSPEYNLEAFNSQDYSITVGTNSITGYNLTLTADSTDLTRTEMGQDGTFAKIPTLAALAGGYTEDTFTVNHWGYKNTTTDANANYMPFSTNINLANTSKPTNGDQIDLNFAAKVDLEQPSGTYKLSLNFQATTNVVLGVENIIFNGNGADNPDAMAVQTISAPGANLNANAFTRAGYEFMGWNTQADGQGTTYTDQANYAVSGADEMKTTVLYAQWAGNYLGVAPSLQEVTAAHCTNSYDGATATQTDARDGKTYTIAKINGICTMTQNLDFELTTGMTLSPDTTNVKSTKTIATVGALSSGNTDTEARIATSSTSGYGTYYNYCAATAGEICVDSSTADATEDVCPAGWRLPTGGQNQEQYILNNSYTWQQYNSNYPREFNPVAAGSYYNGSLNGSGFYGDWWSSTANSTTYRYYLYYNTSNGLYSGHYNYRYSGRSVRCVLGS